MQRIDRKLVHSGFSLHHLPCAFWCKLPEFVEIKITCSHSCLSFGHLFSFKNGSLTRERIRDNCAEGSWDIFSKLLDSTPRGNFGNIGLYYDKQEIIPFLHGDFRFTKNGCVSKFNSLEVEVRAVVEGQFIRNRAYSEDFGFKIGKL